MSDVANKVADALLGEKLFRCYNDECTWKGTNDAGEMDLLDHVHDRVCYGEIMPAGQCPLCGCLIDVPDSEIPSHTLDAIIRVLRERGFEIKEPVK